MQSSATGRRYWLNVSVPDGYSSTGTERYSVLYVLDGNDEFPRAFQSQRLLQRTHEGSGIIVVGIGYPLGINDEPTDRRWADYTPSADPNADLEWEAKRGDRGGPPLRSGDGPRFLKALRTELIPYIEAHYRTNHDRALWGHSLGGLLATYALFAEPGLFSRYAISSPSLWWNNGDTFLREAAFARTHRSLKARVFLSVGAEEDARMLAGVDSLRKVLADRRYRGFVMAAQTFRGANHATVVQDALNASLRFLYDALPRQR